MHENHKPNNHHEHQSKPFYKVPTTRAWVALAVIVGIILFYLLTHHKTHVFEVLPYILILAMILMHIGGHGGHGHGRKKS